MALGNTSNDSSNMDYIKMAYLSRKLGRIKDAFGYLAKAANDPVFNGRVHGDERNLQFFAEVLHERVEPFRVSIAKLASPQQNYTSSEITSQPINKQSTNFQALFQSYLLTIIVEFLTLSNQVNNLINNLLLPCCSSPKARVILYRILGDFWRYIAEIPPAQLKLIKPHHVHHLTALNLFETDQNVDPTSESNHSENGTRSLDENEDNYNYDGGSLNDMIFTKIEDCYTAAHSEAENHLSPVDEATLDVNLILALFYFEYQANYTKGVQVAQSAYFNATLEAVDEELPKIVEILFNAETSANAGNAMNVTTAPEIILDENQFKKYSDNRKLISNLKTLLKYSKITGPK